jgi:hypothetical protein
MREYEYPAETIKEINRINKYKKRAPGWSSRRSRSSRWSMG